jgi:hypothetical protein
MPTAYYEQTEEVVPHNRYHPIPLSLYQEDGETPLGIAADDNVRFKVWATDGGVPVIECQSVTPGSGSFVEVVGIGSSGTTPATVVVKLLQADTALLTVGTQYYGELLLIDKSDSNKAKSLTKFPIRVDGTAAGSVAVT